jgi:hypothetical protein
MHVTCDAALVNEMMLSCRRVNFRLKIHWSWTCHIHCVGPLLHLQIDRARSLECWYAGQARSTLERGRPDTNTSDLHSLLSGAEEDFLARCSRLIYSAYSDDQAGSWVKKGRFI